MKKPIVIPQGYKLIGVDLETNESIFEKVSVFERFQTLDSVVKHIYGHDSYDKYVSTYYDRCWNKKEIAFKTLLAIEECFNPERVDLIKGKSWHVSLRDRGDGHKFVAEDCEVITCYPVGFHSREVVDHVINNFGQVFKDFYGID